MQEVEFNNKSIDLELTFELTVEMQEEDFRLVADLRKIKFQKE